MILNKILAFKRQEVTERKQHLDEDGLIARLETMEDIPRGFFRALRRKVSAAQPAVIAEIKRATPHAGIIREDFDAAEIAQQYVAHGAACLSVVTDKKFFMGNDIFLRHARHGTDVPVMRRDFIIDRYQIVESRVFGADAVLLTVAALSDADLREYTLLAHDLGMDVVVQVHDEEEFNRALRLPVRAICVNNRNLDDFRVNLEMSVRLQALLPADYLLISEGGIAQYEDIRYLQEHGVQAFLAGTSLMAAAQPGIALANLMGDNKHGE